MSPVLLIILELLLLILLVAASAFFSSAEMSLFSLDRAKLLSFRDDGSSSGKAVWFLMDDYNRTLVTIILSNMFVNSCISMLNDSLIHSSGLRGAAAGIVSAVIAVAVLLLFGEITPMTLAYAWRESWSKKAAPAVVILRKALTPVTVLAEKINGRILDFLGRGVSEPLSPEEYETHLDICARTGAFTGTETEFLKDTLEFAGRNVSEIMCPRVEMAFVRCSDSWESLVTEARAKNQRFLAAGKRHPDDADLLVSVPALMALPPDRRGRWLAVAERAMFVPASAQIMDVLRILRDSNRDACFLSDEYGGVAGMITVQEILTRMTDASTHLASVAAPRRLSARRWEFDGLTPLDVVHSLTGWEPEGDFSSSTLNGLVCELAEFMPSAGMRVECSGAVLTVIEMRGKRAALIDLELPQGEGAAS